MNFSSSVYPFFYMNILMFSFYMNILMFSFYMYTLDIHMDHMNLGLKLFPDMNICKYMDLNKYIFLYI